MFFGNKRRGDLCWPLFATCVRRNLTEGRDQQTPQDLDGKELRRCSLHLLYSSTVVQHEKPPTLPRAAVATTAWR